MRSTVQGPCLFYHSHPARKACTTVPVANRYKQTHPHEQRSIPAVHGLTVGARTTSPARSRARQSVIPDVRKLGGVEIVDRVNYQLFIHSTRLCSCPKQNWRVSLSFYGSVCFIASCSGPVLNQDEKKGIDKHQNRAVVYARSPGVHGCTKAEHKDRRKAARKSDRGRSPLSVGAFASWSSVCHRWSFAIVGGRSLNPWVSTPVASRWII